MEIKSFVGKDLMGHLLLRLLARGLITCSLINAEGSGRTIWNLWEEIVGAMSVSNLSNNTALEQ